VHQPESLDRTVLKQHVSFYHDRVRERVRQGLQLTALLRRHGIFASIGQVADPDTRPQIWKRLPRKLLRDDLNLLWQTYELLCIQEEQIRSTLLRLARRVEPVRRFQELPGIGWIRGLTFFVYLDTPSRFPSKAALWRYCGIGLERKRSGTGPTRTRLTRGGHRRLKNVLLGGAMSAIHRGDNPFADKYAYWTQEEALHPSTARRNVARSLAVTLWSLWKTGRPYDPAQVRGVGRPSSRASS
jgi:transposase